MVDSKWIFNLKATPIAMSLEESGVESARWVLRSIPESVTAQ